MQAFIGINWKVLWLVLSLLFAATIVPIYAASPDTAGHPVKPGVHITSITPAHGSEEGGNVITLRGVGFTGVQVMVGSQPVTPLTRTDTKITFVMPGSVAFYKDVVMVKLFVKNHLGAVTRYRVGDEDTPPTPPEWQVPFDQRPHGGCIHGMPPATTNEPAEMLHLKSV